MKGIRWIISVVLLVIGAAPVHAQGRLNADEVRLYGGRYSVDCRSASAPLLRVVADALMVEINGKRMTGRNVQAAYSYFGQSSPPNYQLALLSDVRKDLQLIFLVFRDKGGQYITPGGDPKVEAALGKSLTTQKFRSCESARAEVAPPPAPVPQTASAVIGPPELLLDRRFKSIYFKALGPMAKESWLTELDGPAPPVKTIKVGGKEYSLVSACKNHDCADNNTVLLYSARDGVVYGKVMLRRRASLIGAPPPAMAAELDRLWLAEWRQNR